MAVIDKNPRSFARLGDDFTGQRVVGFGFDRDTLIEAGVEKTGALAAVTSGDNSNIVIARVAKETFGLERVVARIQEPARAEIYERLGISTVASVRWATDQVLRRMIPDEAAHEWLDPSGSVRLVEVILPDTLAGTPIADLASAGRWLVASVDRLGTGMIPGADTVAQSGDVLHVMVSDEANDDLWARFRSGAQEDAHS